MGNQDPQVKLHMEAVLTAYCRAHDVSYKQGMNYILAPFFLVSLPHSEAVYQCFESFLDRYLHAIFTDDDFGALQCIFRLFRVLLLYHDPELCAFLDQYEMTPELYASPVRTHGGTPRTHAHAHTHKCTHIHNHIHTHTQSSTGLHMHTHIVTPIYDA